MKYTITLAALLLSSAAYAQQGTNITPGVEVGGSMIANDLTNNNDKVGFGDTSINNALVALGTTQATAAPIVNRTNVITTCATGAGVILPALARYSPVTVLNRSGAACLVYPAVGSAAESAPGTVAALNAGVSVASNADVTFRPISATQWDQ